MYSHRVLISAACVCLRVRASTHRWQVLVVPYVAHAMMTRWRKEPLPPTADLAPQVGRPALSNAFPLATPTRLLWQTRMHSLT